MGFLTERLELGLIVEGESHGPATIPEMLAKKGLHLPSQRSDVFLGEDVLLPAARAEAAPVFVRSGSFFLAEPTRLCQAGRDQQKDSQE